MASGADSSNRAPSLKWWMASCVAATEVGCFYYLQRTASSLTVDVVLLLILGALSSFFLGYCGVGFRRWKAFLFAVSIWVASVAVLRFTTPHIVCRSLFVEASSMRLLDQLLWKNTRGQILLVWHGGEEKFAKPVLLNSEGHAVEAKSLERIVSQSVGKPCTVAYRPGYWDFAVRPTSVTITFLDDTDLSQ